MTGGGEMCLYDNGYSKNVSFKKFTDTWDEAKRNGSPFEQLFLILDTCYSYLWG